MVARPQFTKAELATAMSNLINKGELPAGPPELRSFMEAFALRTLAAIGRAFSVDGASEVQAAAQRILIEIARTHADRDLRDPSPFVDPIEYLLAEAEEEADEDFGGDGEE